MNDNHKFCGSDEWRAIVRESILPSALVDVDLGDDLLEVGPGYGATTDVLAEWAPKLTAVEIDPELATMLAERFASVPSVSIINADATSLDFPEATFSAAVSFTMLHHVPNIDLQDRMFAEVRRVLRSGGVFVAGDSLYSPELEAGHVGDTYNPVDPEHLPTRLGAVGFVDVEVTTNSFGWLARGKRP